MFLYHILLVCVYFVSVSTDNRSNGYYIIPSPNIEVFTPQGFRVSIEDAPGIRLFAFHANINAEVKDLEAGALSGDVTTTKHGKWTFKDRRTRLQVGDVIHYWLFVIKDNLGYTADRQSFTVRELIPRGHNGGHRFPTEGKNDTTNSETESSERDMASDLKICEQTLLNATQVLIPLQNVIAKIAEENRQLINFIDRTPNLKMLTLTGRIPPDGDARSTVSFILREKLLLNPLITSAHRISPTNITFEVATISEKFEILNVAKEKLNDSKIIIY